MPEGAQFIIVEHALARDLLRPHWNASRRVGRLQISLGDAPSKKLAQQSKSAVGLDRSAAIVDRIEEPHDVDLSYEVGAAIAQGWEHVERQHALVLRPRALLHLAVAFNKSVA